MAKTKTNCIVCINIDFDDNNDGFFLKSPYHKFKPAEPNVVKESLILTHPAEVYKLRASYGPFEMYEVVPNEILNSLTKAGDVFEKFESDMHRAEAQSDNTDKKYLANVHLLLEQIVYVDHKDKDLIFRVPQLDLQSNTRFEVPVLLEKNSALKEFVVQLRVRGNIVLEGAVPARDSPWSVVIDSSNKEGASVTVSYKDHGKNSQSFNDLRIHEIMKWQFRTLPSSASSSNARIVWNVNFEKQGHSRNPYEGSEGSRVTAKFNIIGGRTEKVIIVMKERNLLNTAILTGNPVTYDLMVYSLSLNNTLKDITKDSSYCIVCINIDFDDNNDGFFLKSPYHKFKPAEPNVVKESLILTHPAEVYKLRASYGPFEMYEVVPNEILNSLTKAGDVFEKFESDMHRYVMHNLDVSAHLVSQTIIPSHPWIQVLVHVQTLSRKQKQDMIYHYYGVTQRWCAQIFVSRGHEQHTAVCLLEGEHNSACVASLPVPEHWWDFTNLTLFDQEVKVYYDLSRVEQSQECASVSNTIVPARAEAQSDNTDKKYLANVHLLLEQIVYADHKDKDLIFRVPQLDLQSNTRFEVPVLLEKNSALKEFVVQLRVRGNIVLEGAVPARDSPWSVVIDSSNKEGASVTVSYKDHGKNSQSFNDLRIHEIMKWQFRTLPSPASSSNARIVWNVNFEKQGLSRNPYVGSEGSRVTAKFNIIGGRTEKVIIVMKERNLLNTAILTGNPVTYDLMVYSLSLNNTLKDITKDSSCKSTDPEALQVSHSCDIVFLDGSETRGAKNVTLLVRTGDHVSQIGVRVWVPEPRLEIQLSDSKLSQIRGWRTPSQTLSLSKRSAELPSQNNVTDNDKESSEPLLCQSKYQQTLIDVYARFTISAPGESPLYFRNRKIYIRVTNLVRDRLKVANPNIARIVGSTVQGVSPGLTEVQVISPTGKLLGAKEIKVAKDKVAIERLLVRVISGMGLRISEDPNLPGALLATVTLRDQLVAKQQEAVLDIAVEFKDGSMLPLSNVAAEEYELEVTSMNTDVVEVTETLPFIPAIPPSIKAIGNGKGEIVRVILRESETCSKRTARSLDTEYVHVQVDFTKDLDFYNLVQSDSNYYHRSSEKRPMSNEQENFSHKDEYFKKQQKKHEFEEDSGYYKSSKSGPKVFPVVEDLEKLETYTASDDSEATKEPKSEALEQPVSTKAKHPSPLEIGMYVLVAVFVFAILVFTANCAVFMVRYQRKRSPKNSRVMTGSISQAPDWVWIGRATLERNGAGSAGCNHALMAEEDFNGNQMVVPNASDRQLPSQRRPVSGDLNISNSTSGVTGSGSSASESNRNSIVSTYKGSECSIRITSNPLPDNDCGMGYNEAEWDYEAMGMTYEQLMEYFDNLKESSA
ncbi:hypothetical protein Btru_000831 [Bulinus truncatus]|nr:hypothetical protein Btru_000831 [Bulinus truncatus]